MSLWGIVLSSSTRLRGWASHHSGELLWAAVFAVVVGLPAAVYFAYFVTDPPPFKVYVVAGSHFLTKSTDPNLDTTQQFKSSFLKRRLANAVDIDLEVVELSDDKPETAESKAQELVTKGDALIVIGHLDSEPTEASLGVYLKERPQVPFIASVQTDDGLLKKACPTESGQRSEDSLCYDGSKPLPYLQLSPTNLEQARWATRFATENHAHKFLIVENDGVNKTYAESLAADYSKAVVELNHAIGEKHNIDHTRLSTDEVLTESLVQVQTLSDEILWKQFKDDDIDCVLYAGGFDGADALLKQIVDLKEDRLRAGISHRNTNESTIAGKPLMVILDDSVAEERFSGTNFDMSPIHITDQADAEDYDKGISVYGLDAITIAAQLIDDLNKRGFDWRFRIRKTLHRLTVEDARRNLVRVMQQNYDYHASYFGAVRTGIAPDSRTVYAFDGNLRANGLFHVWERAKLDKGYRNTDVDRWHPPKNIPSSTSGETKLSQQKVTSAADYWWPKRAVVGTVNPNAFPMRQAAERTKTKQ